MSILGNKIHIYKISDCSLVKCILIGLRIYNIENISFISNKQKENYFFVNLNNNSIKIYRLKNIEKNFCICDNYLDDDILTNKIKEDKIKNFFSNYLFPIKNTDITESHLNIDSNNDIIFSEFFVNLFIKSFVIIDNKGFYYIYFFDKEKTKTPIYYAECKWI